MLPHKNLVTWTYDLLTLASCSNSGIQECELNCVQAYFTEWHCFCRPRVTKKVIRYATFCEKRKLTSGLSYSTN